MFGTSPAFFYCIKFSNKKIDSHWATLPPLFFVGSRGCILLKNIIGRYTFTYVTNAPSPTRGPLLVLDSR